MSTLPPGRTLSAASRTARRVLRREMLDDLDHDEPAERHCRDRAGTEREANFGPQPAVARRVDHPLIDLDTARRRRDRERSRTLPDRTQCRVPDHSPRTGRRSAMARLDLFGITAEVRECFRRIPGVERGAGNPAARSSSRNTNPSARCCSMSRSCRSSAAERPRDRSHPRALVMSTISPTVRATSRACSWACSTPSI